MDPSLWGPLTPWLTPWFFAVYSRCGSTFIDSIPAASAKTQRMSGVEKPAIECAGAMTLFLVFPIILSAPLPAAANS